MTTNPTVIPARPLEQLRAFDLTVVDLDEVLARLEAKVIEARAAIADEAEGRLNAAVESLVIEAALAHRIVTTW